MTRSLTIRGVTIDEAGPAYTIAELGSNGAADTELTKRFIKAAADAGASSVKTQARTNHKLFTRAALAAPYTGPNSYGPTYGEHRVALEYSGAQHLELCEYAHSLGIAYGSTPFDPDAATLLASVGVDFIKIASACVSDTVLLEHCARIGIPMVVSTGTANQHDVDLAVETIIREGCPLAVLQCSAVYPNPDPALLNLRVIETYRQRYPFLVTGLSSHFPLGWDAVLAYAMGGRIFEKHFTLDRSMRGADHQFSLTPPMFRSLVDRLAHARTALGSAAKVRLPEEQGAVTKMGKTLRAARAIPAGHTLTRADIAIKSPGGEGPPPSRLAEYVGRTIKLDLAEDEALPELRWYQ